MPSAAGRTPKTHRLMEERMCAIFCCTDFTFLWIICQHSQHWQGNVRESYSVWRQVTLYSA